ncbi:MAG: lytic murein transglycosylase B [Pseudomonadales bacterium]
MLKRFTLHYLIKATISFLAAGSVISSSSLALAADSSSDTYGNHPEAKRFVDKMVVEHGFDRGYVQRLMNSAQRKQSVLDAIARPAEKTKTWKEYRKIFVNKTRAQQGIEFMKTHAKTLTRAEREFGVPAEIISAIIGVETRYGRHKGSYRVLDSLATLGFDYPPRASFFSGQLEQYLLLVKEQKLDPRTIKGSYAGAMGYGQFIPSSYRHYAIDFDGDGVADIVNNPVDAIGSVANYFKSHGWKPGQPITTTASVSIDHKADVANQKLTPKLTVTELQQQGYQSSVDIEENQLATAMRLQGNEGSEYWLGLQNFYVITRYNHSRLYAMAVYQLSEELKGAN